MPHGTESTTYINEICVVRTMYLPLALLRHHDQNIHYIEASAQQYEEVRHALLTHYAHAPHHLALCLTYTSPSLVLHQTYPRVAFIDGISQAAAGSGFSNSGAVMLRHPLHTSDALFSVSEYVRQAPSPYVHVLVDGLHVLSWYMRDHALLSLVHSLADALRRQGASASLLSQTGELSGEVSRHIAHFCDTSHVIEHEIRYPWSS